MGRQAASLKTEMVAKRLDSALAARHGFSPNRRTARFLLPNDTDTFIVGILRYGQFTPSLPHC